MKFGCNPPLILMTPMYCVVSCHAQQIAVFIWFLSSSENEGGIPGCAGGKAVNKLFSRLLVRKISSVSPLPRQPVRAAVITDVNSLDARAAMTRGSTAPWPGMPAAPAQRLASAGC